MLTTLLLAAFLAAPDAGVQADPFAPSGQHLALEDFFAPPRPPEKSSPFVDQFNADVLTESLEWWAIDEDWAAAVRDAAPLVQVLSTRQGQRIICSALLCHSVQLLTDPDDHSTTIARRRLIGIGLMATERLERSRIVPLTCDRYPVARLVQCLGLLPDPECATDPELALQVKAAERLETTP